MLGGSSSVFLQRITVEAQKYVDDMTTVESIPRSATHYMDKVYETRLFHARETENSISILKKTCEEKNLKINAAKTQLLALSADKEKTKVWISEEDEEILSGEELKLLGFYFSKKPTVARQVEYITKRAMLRFFVLRKYSRFMPGSDLRKLYCGLVRSVIEYSSVTYGPMLTKYQSNTLENIQKRCLRVMYGYDKSYTDLLVESGLQTLSNRRDKAMPVSYTHLTLPTKA